MTFDRVTVYCLKKYFRLLTLTATAQLTLNRKSYQLSKPEIEFHVMKEMYAALRMCACAEKTTFLGKDDLTTYSEIFWHERQLCMVPRLWPYCGRNFF